MRFNQAYLPIMQILSLRFPPLSRFAIFMVSPNILTKADSVVSPLGTTVAVITEGGDNANTSNTRKKR